MHGKWLFKEIKTEYGQCKVEIFRKGYTATAIEIGALESNSLTLAMENLGNITDPIGKSVCSFSIIDTAQLDYDDFFTPDATAYKVVVSTRVGEGAYVTRWSGYITPDFFAENLSYRTPISISARDNIGYLNDVDFDLDVSTITVRELIQAAFNRIAEDYPMQIVFATQKQTAEGILAIDATISSMLLREGTWYEAIETILHDLGLQMRWVDNNTIAVLDLSQMPEYYSTQAFNFIDTSGYREILPAWRELSQEQDYGVLDNFYKGQIDGENKLEYAANSVISSNVLLYQPKAITQWSRQGEIYFLNFFNSYNAEIGDDKQDSIYITGVGPSVTNADVLNQKMVYSQAVTEVDKQIKITFSLNDTLRTPLTSQYSRGEKNTLYLPYSAASGTTMIRIPQPYQLKYRFNIFLRANDGTNYVMRDKWEELSTMTEQPFIEFLTDKLQTIDTGVTDGQGNHRFAFTGYDNSKEYSIIVGSIPKAGTLEFVVYPWTFEKDDYTSTRDEATFQRGAKITDIVFSVQVGKTGVSARTQVGVSHNIKSNVDYKFGQVPQREGDVITYAGGLFQSDTITALQGFQRNANATNYNLLELVGREIIHFNKKNYNKLSGTIRNLAKEPLMFNRLFVREGKKYAPFAYSLNVISNEMSITTMQEVEEYTTEQFSEINSVVTTGGAIVSAGNNTVMQYSQDAGNTKRIYELTAATEEEKKDTWVMIDGTAFPEARKINVKDLEGLNEEQVEAYLTSNAYAKESWVTNITKGLAQDIANRVLIEDFEKLEDAVNDNRQSIGVVQGYFNNGVANDASKLGGKAPSHYATATALGTTNTNVDNVAARVATLEGNFKGGDAKNALKLGEHLPEYFATAEGLSTVDSALTAAKNRVTTLEGYFSSGIAKEAAKVSKALTFGSKTFNGSSAQTILASDLDAVTTAGGQTITGAKTFSALITANGGIVVPKTKSIKVGDAELVWDDTIKALKVVGAMYTTGTFAFGGDEEPESGGGGGAAGIVTVRVNGYDYNSVNGIVTLPDYPSLSGYATENWVNNKGYITGINSSMVTNALGYTPYNSTNPSGYITSAALNGYATQSWVGDNYLPKSGGMIESSSATPLIIRNSTYYGYLPIYCSGALKVSFGHYSGAAYLSNETLSAAPRLVVTDSGVPQFWDSSSGTNKYTLYHTGNFNPSDYLPLSGGKLTGWLQVESTGTILACINTAGYTPYINFRSYINGVNTDLGDLGVDTDKTLKYYNGGAWRTIIHTGNYSSYALPLSGGTLTNSLAVSNGTISSTRTSTRRAVFYKNASEAMDAGTYIVDVSDGGDAVLKLTYNDLTWKNNTVIHSGNIGSQSVSYANNAGTLELKQSQNPDDVLQGRLFSTPYNSSLPTGATNYLSGITFASDNNSNYRLQLALDYYGKVFSRSQRSGTWYGWKELAFTDSNVASATKLATARTIWGQSFDGSGDVSGDILNAAGGIYLHNTNEINSFNGALYLNHRGTNNPTSYGITGPIVMCCHGGNILMGTTTDNGAKLQVNGGATFGGAVAINGELSWSSDIRLKDNVTYLSAEHSLGIIRQLKPTSWNWKKDGKASFGLIAQDVQPIIPEMVTNGEYLHLQYNHLHAFEIGAIQHIDNEVETLKKDLKVANNRIEALENELKQYRRS